MDPTISQAQDRYPILNRLDVQYKRNIQPNRGFLEFYAGDEPGTPEHPRPSEFTPGKIGVEIFDERTRPIDILGDVVSHQLVKTDPVIKRFYDHFTSSLTDTQQSRLREQYTHAKTNEGETRPFEQWKEMTGLPAYFRGYAFQQWDKPESMYTKKQMQMFDGMMEYLGRK